MYKLYTFVGKALGIKLAGKGNLVLFMKGLLLIRTLKNVQLKDSQGNGLFVLFLWGKRGVFRGRGGKRAVPRGGGNGHSK